MSGSEKSFRKTLSLDNNSNINIDYLLFNIGTSYYLNGRKINSYPALLKEIEKNRPYKIIHVGNTLVADTNGGGFRGITNSASKYEVDPKILSTIRSLSVFEIAVSGDYGKVGNENHGSITPLKGLRELSYAFKNFNREFFSQIVLLMAGKYYSYIFFRELESIDQHISYLGELQGKELIKRILQSDLILQPTYHDSFNLSALEGLMLLKKVIVTHISSMYKFWVKSAYTVGVLPNPYILGRENEMEAHCTTISKYFIEALKNTLRDVLLKDQHTSKSPHDIHKEVKERYNGKKMQELYQDLYFSLL